MVKTCVFFFSSISVVIHVVDEIKAVRVCVCRPIVSSFLFFYCFQVACTAGALLGGASDKDVKNMEVFSESIGLAFQGKRRGRAGKEIVTSDGPIFFRLRSVFSGYSKKTFDYTMKQVEVVAFRRGKQTPTKDLSLITPACLSSHTGVDK